MSATDVSRERSPALLALREGWPVLVSPPLIGVTYGVLARQAGLDPIQTAAMSLLVFAGAAQFAAIELLRGGAGSAIVLATVLFINLRHLLMGAALRPSFRGRSPAQRLGLAYLLVDETFAMGVGWYRRGGRGVAYYVAFGLTLWAGWQIGSIVGVLVGSTLPEPRRIGLDFAITATFVSIVVLGVRDRRDVAVALVAGLLAAALRGSGLAVVAVVIAGALAPIVGLRDR